MSANQATDLVEIPCPLCGATERTVRIEGNLNDLDSAFDYFSESGGHFQINTCSACEFVYSSPIFTEERIQELYDGADSEGAVSDETLDGALVNNRRYVERLMRHSGINSGKLLDIGCGCGQLLQQARELGLETYGIDPSAEGARLSSEFAEKVVHGNYDTAAFPANTFDLISIIHVIDHTVTPLQMLKDAMHHLRPGGALIVATHNIESLLARIMGKSFIAYNIQHVSYFTPRSLEQMARAAGLEPLRSLKSITTYSLEHYAQNGLPEGALRNTVLSLFGATGLGKLMLSFPFGNIELVARKPD